MRVRSAAVVHVEAEGVEEAARVAEHLHHSSLAFSSSWGGGGGTPRVWPSILRMSAARSLVTPISASTFSRHSAGTRFLSPKIAAAALPLHSPVAIRRSVFSHHR